MSHLTREQRYTIASMLLNGDLLMMPVTGLLGITPILQYFSLNVGLEFLQGVILKTIAVLVTMFCTRIKWFW
ncbi:MAG TPA: hypothetical protein PLH52_06230 [Paludibacteraceae bacterium]|nr:hypothetical protein [Paludibacteraceae bacterium]